MKVIANFLKLISLLSLLLIAIPTYGQVLRERTTAIMGSRFDITIVAKDSLTAEQSIDSVIAEMRRIEDLISDWKTSTQIANVNLNAGIKPVVVDKEVFELTRRSIYFSVITDGAFDISYAALDKIWKFDGSMKRMPTAEEIQHSVSKVGYENVVLDSVASTIFLKLKGMKIGFGAMGKGYAADKGRALMEAKGINAGIVNASGDLTTWGSKPNGDAWHIGITNPFNEKKFIVVVPLKREAVATSGSYEKFVNFNGVRYSHIINPATGYPATGLISVSVFGPSAEIANGISTSIMVLGAAKGMKLMKKFPKYRCLMVTDDGRVVKSDNFKVKVKRKLK